MRFVLSRNFFAKFLSGTCWVTLYFVMKIRIPMEFCIKSTKNILTSRSSSLFVLVAEVDEVTGLANTTVSSGKSVCFEYHSFKLAKVIPLEAPPPRFRNRLRMSNNHRTGFQLSSNRLCWVDKTLRRERASSDSWGKLVSFCNCLTIVVSVSSWLATLT